MSAGNRVQWLFKTTTFGAVASGTYDELRYVDDDVKLEYEVAESDEVRSDGNVASIDVVGMKAMGPISHKLSYGTYDKIIEPLFRADSTWAGTATINTTVSASSADNSFNDSANGFTSPAFDPGKLVKGAGWTNGANNQWFLIVTRPTNGKITVIGANALVTETALAGKTVAVMDSISNGITQVPFTIERRYNDLASTLMRFDDMCVAGLDFQFDAKSYMAGKIDFDGKTGALQTSSSASGITSANTNPPFKGVNNVPWFLVNNVALTIMRANFRIENTLVPTEEVNTLGPTSQGVGQFRVRGGFAAYFNATNKSNLGLFEARTTVPIAVALRDDNGKGYGLWLPSARLTKGKSVGVGTDKNVIAEFEFDTYVGASGSASLTARLSRVP